VVADHSGRAARSNTGIVGSNPTWGMDVCVRFFCVSVVLYVVSGFATGILPHPRSPTDCAQDQETEKAAKTQQEVAEP
jgi:hypothetical protein